MAAEPASWGLVDQLGSIGAELGKGTLEVVDGERHMVEARTASLEESRDAALRIEGPDQLEVTVTGSEGDGLHSLIGERLPHHHFHREPAGVERELGVDVRDRIPNMMDAGEMHAGTLSAAHDEAGHRVP